MEFRTFEAKPVGYIYSEFKNLKDVPLNGADDMNDGRIEIVPEYKDCILGLEQNSKIYVFSWMHKGDRTVHQVYPHRRFDKPPRGVFSTCSPVRPNLLGMSYMEVQRVEDNILYVKGVDLLDGTPIFDIKKYDDAMDN